jgi:hypothetical protein
MSDKPKYYQITAERNEISTNDDWLEISPSKDYSFLGMKGIKQMHYLGTEPDLLFRASVVQSQEKVYFSRDCYNIIDLCGDVGGVLQILLVVLAAILSNFSE